MAKWLKGRERSTYFAALAGLFLTAAIVANPEEAFKASINGLRVWWDIVFPALLPFFIASEILMGLGVVHFMGALLEPLMRPIFRVPGVGAFALAMGLASGYPIGAKITSRLRKDNLCTQIEAERLLSFTNTADPLFMIGAVAVGMFQKPELALPIAGAHYISSIILGFLLRFHEFGKNDITYEKEMKENILSKAFRELYTARTTDGRSFGQLFGDSVKDSVNTLLLIGGFIMTFSVLIRILDIFGIISIVSSILLHLLKPFNVNGSIIKALVNGIFEITIGTEVASQATGPIMEQVMAASAIIAWSGISVHAQVASMINGTDIRMTPYLIARVIHSVIAAIVTYFLMGPLKALVPPSFVPVLSRNTGSFGLNILTRTAYYGWRILILLCLLIIISLTIYIIKNVKVAYFKFKS